MRARIHRGAREVGGSCIELAHEGARLLLDLGLPLGARDVRDVPLPDIAGLEAPDASLLGVVLSHPHLDHYGLVCRARAALPVFMGEAAARILEQAAFFSGAGLARPPAGFLRHRTPLQVGPFTITPYLNDHSAFDAYSVLVEAGGRRLFYSGDFRAHGRKPRCFQELVERPPHGLHALLMEGTHVHGVDAAKRGPSERDVENSLIAVFRRAPGAVLALYSPQNVDRLVTMYRACLRSGRTLVMDLYAATIAAATGCASIPRPGWDRVRVYLPRRQKMLVVRHEAFHRTAAVRSSRIFAEELAERRAEFVLTFRQSMAAELEEADCLAQAEATWSMWPGYLREPSGEVLLDWLRRHGIELSVHHSSGHASVADLQTFVVALNPDRVVPIHTFAPEAYPSWFASVEGHADLEWWDV